MSQKLQPALLGGLLIGVLSALPFVGACCCLWVLAGGVLTTYLLQERMTVPVTAGDASLAGLLAGVFGAVVSTLLGHLIAIITGATVTDAINTWLGRGDLPPEMSGALQRVRDIPSALLVIVSLIATMVIFPIFSMLGALLGVAIFRKTPPPPPAGTVEILPPE